METLIIGLGPAFAAGFAIQQLLEKLGPLLDKNERLKKKKGMYLGILSLALGLGIAFGAGLKVLDPLGAEVSAPIWDTLATGLVISGGTEGINSILKFMGYKKDAAKVSRYDAGPERDN